MTVCPFVHLSNSLFLNLAAHLSICQFNPQSCPHICLSFISPSVHPYRNAEKTDEWTNREIIGRHIKARYDQFLQLIYTQYFIDIISDRSGRIIIRRFARLSTYLLSVYPSVSLPACLYVCLLSGTHWDWAQREVGRRGTTKWSKPCLSFPLQMCMWVFSMHI